MVYSEINRLGTAHFTADPSTDEVYMESIEGPGGIHIDVKPSTLLLVDDEENILASLRRLLRKDGYTILTANSGEEGLAILGTETVDVIISDQRMPNMVGTVFLSKARELSPHSVRIILSGYTDLASVTAAINEGAVYKFLTKPWEDDILRLSIREALQYKWVQEENRLLQGMLVEANTELEKTNRQLAEQADFAQETLKNQQSMVFNLPIAVLGLDDNGLLMFANQASLDLLGSSLHLCQPAAPMLPEEIGHLIGDSSSGHCKLTLAGTSYTALIRSLAPPANGKVIVIFPHDAS
jgi:FixJ family two-component response regulator